MWYYYGANAQRKCAFILLQKAKKHPTDADYSLNDIIMTTIVALLLSLAEDDFIIIIIIIIIIEHWNGVKSNHKVFGP
jgi:hypothetical protein